MLKNKYNFCVFLLMNKCIFFLLFLNKGFTMIFLIYFHPHYLYITFSTYLCSKAFSATYCFINLDNLSPQLTQISEGLL
jgi:hypothetical protein